MDYCSITNSTLFENCLTGLTVKELLTLKHSLNDVRLDEDRIANRYIQHPTSNIMANSNDCNNNTGGECLKPTTMALVAEDRYHDTIYESHKPLDLEEKPTKLQTLFYVSVTALSFLSFGGYLLCLIVQSIKNRGKAYYSLTPGTTATPNNVVKRVKVYHRGRRLKRTITTIQHSDPYRYYINKLFEEN